MWCSSSRETSCPVQYFRLEYGLLDEFSGIQLLQLAKIFGKNWNSRREHEISSVVKVSIQNFNFLHDKADADRRKLRSGYESGLIHYSKHPS